MNSPLIYKKKCSILFIKNKHTESDNDFLSKNADAKQAIIDSLNTPLEQRSEYLDW